MFRQLLNYRNVAVADLNRLYFVLAALFEDQFDRSIALFAIDVWHDLIIIAHGLAIV